MLFRRKERNEGGVSSADADTLFAEIETLTRSNRAHRDPDNERRLLELRHRAGKVLTAAPTEVEGAGPDFEALPDDGSLPEIRPGDLTPELLRAGILRDGCLLVRGLIDPGDAAILVEEIDAALAARDAHAAGDSGEPAQYEEFVGDEEDKAGLMARQWVSGGGVWAADSPRAMFSMIDALERNGVRELIGGYLGERPAFSVQKCTLRRVEPDTGSAWHQDGAFLGEVKALNVWVALNRCGDEAPGLDIVPRRLDTIVATGTEGAIFDWSVAPAVAEEAAGDKQILRPVFEAGDVLFFDDLFLHATATSESMTKTRYAVESWFFGPSAFPAEYVPLAL